MNNSSITEAANILKKIENIDSLLIRSLRRSCVIELKSGYGNYKTSVEIPRSFFVAVLKVYRSRLRKRLNKLKKVSE